MLNAVQDASKDETVHQSTAQPSGTGLRLAACALATSTNNLTCTMRWRLDAWRMPRLVPWKREVPSGIAVEHCSALPDVDAVATMR
jgi:hypothetical protein